MGILNNLLASYQAAGFATNAGITAVSRAIGIFTIVILVACGLILTVFAVYLGYKMATAEDDKKRGDAKTHLIYAIVGLVSIIVLAVMLRVVIPALGANAARATSNDRLTGDYAQIVNVLGAIGEMVGVVLNVLSNAAILFAMYLGWKLMSAEDDAKRKNAKQQLVYTLVAVAGVILLNVIISAVINQLITTQVANLQA